MKKHQSNKSTTKPGLALLLLLALWGMGGFWECEGLLAAVTVTPISTDYAAKKVTFKVAWQNASVPYNNRVWVWIDYCPVTGNVPAASHATATVSNPEITGGYGTVTGATERGFFIEYANATNTGATVTATLSYASDKFNWCAYGSDYPPNAVDNGSGGYTLRGTKPFTINGSLIVDANTFGAGTCIASIADLTGRPDGFAPPSLTLGNLNSPSRCGAGAVTLSATASGATTPTMTYTWTVGGSTYTTSVNSYTTSSLSASAAYTVKVKNAYGCESKPESGNITVGYAASDGQRPSGGCGCVTGTVLCTNICYKNENYTTYDGACSETLGYRWTRLHGPCGNVINEKYSLFKVGNCRYNGCSWLGEVSWSHVLKHWGISDGGDTSRSACENYCYENEMCGWNWRDDIANHCSCADG